jgi:hypothetical protein
MITKEKANLFAKDWINSWNSHDLDRVMSHYDDVEYFSMFLAKLTENKSGFLKGKKNVQEYLSKGLQSYPDLKFKLENIFLGISSVTLQYISVNNLVAAEVFEFNERGLVSRVQCHYAQD